MYKSAYYICDRCGAEMAPLPTYTLNLNAQSFYFYKQDQVTWHYCEDCWEDVKKLLIENEPNVLKKTIEELKEENEKLKKDASWYQEFWLAMFKAAQKNREKYAYSSPYMSYTVSTKGEKTIQAEPAGDGPFTVECCCENTNKDSLDYKQTVGMI